jgi:hypothetical protein
MLTVEIPFDVAKHKLECNIFDSAELDRAIQVKRPAEYIQITVPVPPKRHGFWELSQELRCYMVATANYWFIKFSDDSVTTEHADASIEENWDSAVQVLLASYPDARLLTEDEL